VLEPEIKEVVQPEVDFGLASKEKKRTKRKEIGKLTTLTLFAE